MTIAKSNKYTKLQGYLHSWHHLSSNYIIDQNHPLITALHKWRDQHISKVKWLALDALFPEFPLLRAGTSRIHSFDWYDHVEGLTSSFGRDWIIHLISTAGCIHYKLGVSGRTLCLRLIRERLEGMGGGILISYCLCQPNQPKMHSAALW